MNPRFLVRFSYDCRIGLVAMMLVATLCSGCLRRRFTVRTNPPGAVLYVDNQEIGITPVSTSYTYYGTREIRLEKDGFEPVVKLHDFRPPWYQIPPLDFVSENIVPWEIRDQRELSFEMVQLRLVPPEELRARAEQLRRNAQAGFSTPMVPPERSAVDPTVVAPPAQRVPLWDSMQQPQLEPNRTESLPSPYHSQPNPSAPQSLPPGGYQLPPLPGG